MPPSRAPCVLDQNILCPDYIIRTVLGIIYSEMIRKARCTMSFVRLEPIQGASRFSTYNPDIIIVFRIIIFEHPVFEVSRKNCRFFLLPENEIRTARLYTPPQPS